ncbi:two-component system sensor histidine kinase DesK [Conyzicola lurida]|uniref:Two-component system sensor histidine kinase DesK n=1 Tax=Conyzicola lurida TaxID=1172621 RepID=A0A841AKR7_9MICO|nr:two-component system sensor histidine kinase DesK [Conyzicola lurida]
MTTETRGSQAHEPRSLPVLATARGVNAAWWYTAVGIVFFDLVVVFSWAATLLQLGAQDGAVIAVTVGGLLWIVSTLPPLLAYRHRSGEPAAMRWRAVLIPVVIAVAYGVLAFSLSGLWLLLVVPLAQSLQLLDWPRTVRLRMVLVATALLVCLWVIDANGAFSAALSNTDGYLASGLLAVIVPLITVLSLWWWDVLIALDRARVSEARLAATQERLSVATDVHDLQGHHLQVIALQLELTERLIGAGDQPAALEQLRAARVSVDEARQGTRDLATRFRSVPLRDELANARDLLRAAGIAAETVVGAGTDDAPASVFGPVIRETTTNVLRHGGGKHTTLSLSRTADAWRYEITNDMDDAGPSPSDGINPRREHTGLDGLARRAEEVGGALEIVRGDGSFTVVVTVPVS